MPRSKNKVASHRRRRNHLKRAKGYWGNQGNVLTAAKNAIDKGLGHVYRSLWIVRINAAARTNGTTYSRLIDALNKKGVDINRKVLASLAAENPTAFSEVVKFSIN